MTLASPCIGTCVLDEVSGLCTGCARTGEEIFGWRDAKDAWRARVWAALPGRAAALGIALRRLNWRGARVLDEVERRFREGACVVAGVPGALAEALRAPGELLEVLRGGAALTLRTPRAALRLEAPDWLTAFEVSRPDAPPLLALAVPLGRAGPRGPAALADLGPDPAALLPRDAGGRRFDLGLGRHARFAVRVSDDLAARLAPHLGAPWPAHLARTASPILAESPVRVIEAPCLRAEVDAPIPAPGGRAPDGPHTHLLPDAVAVGRDLPPGVPLPDRYVPVALVYP